LNILVIDAQGGGIGRQLVSAVKAAHPEITVMAVGTNSAATAAMLKAGADHGATGENAAVVCSRKADLIVGPIGIVIADSMLGEITPTVAAAVGQSSAVRILIPVSHCESIIAGTAGLNMNALIQSAVEEIGRFCARQARNS